MSPDTDPTIAETILKELKRQRYALIVLAALFLAAGVVGYVALSNRGDDNERLAAKAATLAQNAETDHAALCTFRVDLQSRVSETVDYLRTHPKGFPGVPLKTLQTSLNGQKLALQSLQALNCP
jgi:Flp pilus assembly protein CpaB